jgi:uncharacterized protein YaeQ
VALSATIYTFSIELADMDRGVYESLALTVARHPSEAEEFLVTRVLAYCAEYAEGIAFSRGISTPDEPAINIRDLTGRITAWIDVGAPDADRVHRASKTADRVVVYTHKDPERVLGAWHGHRLHRSDAITLVAVPPSLVTALAARLERRMAFTLTVTDGHVYAAFDDASIDGELRRFSAADA